MVNSVKSSDWWTFKRLTFLLLNRTCMLTMGDSRTFFIGSDEVWFELLIPAQFCGPCQMLCYVKVHWNSFYVEGILGAHYLEFYLFHRCQQHGTDSPEVRDLLCLMQKYSLNVCSSLMLSNEVKSISSSAEAKSEWLPCTHTKILTNAHMKTLTRPGYTLNNRVWV